MKPRGGDNAMVAAMSAGRRAPKALAKTKGKAPEMAVSRTNPAASTSSMKASYVGSRLGAKYK